MGALTLANSIKEKGSKASLVCLISSDVSKTAQDLLKKVFDIVTVVPVFNVKVTLPPHAKYDQAAEAKERLCAIAFTKFHALNLTQFDKVVVLDADTICSNNPDAIFQVQAPAAICTAIKNNNAAHGKPVDPKIVEKAYKENGMPGNVYLFKPSKVDWERVVKGLTIKVKIATLNIVKTAGGAIKSKAGGSTFAGFGDDDDDDDDEEREEQTQQAPREDLVKTTRYLTKEDIEMARFDDDKVEKKIEFPFDIMELDSAPMGFGCELRKVKTAMNPDEAFISDLFAKSWKHLHPIYGTKSWKALTPSKNNPEPVFLHFTQKAWAVDETQRSKWEDLVFYDFAAIDLYNKFKNDAEMVTFIKANFPVLDEKIKQQAEGVLVLPSLSAPVPAPVAAPTAEPEAVEKVEAVEPEKKDVVLKAAPVPTKSAWGQ
jgi:lipopolysaccharide biosynthesis glycosyltransferase